MTDATLWDASGDVVAFEVRGRYPAPAVTVWAGGELDPCYLTPGEARRAADEWPAILRRLADEAEAVIAELAAAPKCDHGRTEPHDVYRLEPPPYVTHCPGPEPATCEHESHAYIGEQRVGSFKELDGNRWAPCSATPTGPEPAKCEHKRTQAHQMLDEFCEWTADCPGPATPTGPESCDHGLVRCAVCGTDSPATPEPTEETP